MNNLKSIIEQAECSMKDAENELLRMHPVGAHIEFYIMAGQQNASTGTVLGATWYCQGLYLRVRHHQAKPHSRYVVRFVHYKSIAF